MKILIVLILIAVSVTAQTSKSKESEQLAAVRAEFAQATEEYKRSLAESVTRREANLKKAEENLELSKGLFSEGRIPPRLLQQHEQQLKAAQDDLAKSRQDLADADKQITALADAAKVDEEYKRALLARKRARLKPCRNWDAVITRRETAQSIALSYKIVCR